MKSRSSKRRLSVLSPALAVLFIGLACVSLNSGEPSDLAGIGLCVLLVMFLVRGKI